MPCWQWHLRKAWKNHGCRDKLCFLPLSCRVWGALQCPTSLLICPSGEWTGSKPADDLFLHHYQPQEHIFVSIFLFLKKKIDWKSVLPVKKHESEVALPVQTSRDFLRYIPVSCISTQIHQTCSWIQQCDEQNQPLEPQFLLLLN